jgi:hypothetical protein
MTTTMTTIERLRKTIALVEKRNASLKKDYDEIVSLKQQFLCLRQKTDDLHQLINQERADLQQSIQRERDNLRKLKIKKEQTDEKLAESRDLDEQLKLLCDESNQLKMKTKLSIIQREKDHIECLKHIECKRNLRIEVLGKLNQELHQLRQQSLELERLPAEEVKEEEEELLVYDDLQLLNQEQDEVKITTGIPRVFPSGNKTFTSRVFRYESLDEMYSFNTFQNIIRHFHDKLRTKGIKGQLHITIRPLFHSDDDDEGNDNDFDIFLGYPIAIEGMNRDIGAESQYYYSELLSPLDNLFHRPDEPLIPVFFITAITENN